MLSTIKATISMYRRQSEEAKKLENEQAKLNEATCEEDRDWETFGFDFQLF